MLSFRTVMGKCPDVTAIHNLKQNKIKHPLPARNTAKDGDIFLTDRVGSFDVAESEIPGKFLN